MFFRLSNLIIYFPLLCLLSCRFNASPYVSKTPKLQRNNSQIITIKDLELSSPADFKVALISDTHNYYEEFGQLVKAINTNGPYSFVIVTGDITNFGLLDEYDESRRYLNRLNFPSVVAVGNHDLLSKGDVIFERMFGSSNFTFIYKNVHFIFFNNNNWESSGQVPDKPFIESALMASTSPFKILVAHVSPDDRDRFDESVIAEWAAMMTNYNVNYFINGHNHNPTESDFGGARQITVGAPSKKSYYELIISAGGITHKKISF